MASCFKDTFDSRSLRCFKSVKAAFQRTSSELMNQHYVEPFLKCGSTSSSTIASNCVGLKPIDDSPFSMSYLL